MLLDVVQRWVLHCPAALARRAIAADVRRRALRSVSRRLVVLAAFIRNARSSHVRIRTESVAAIAAVARVHAAEVACAGSTVNDDLRREVDERRGAAAQDVDAVRKRARGGCNYVTSPEKRPNPS